MGIYHVIYFFSPILLVQQHPFPQPKRNTQMLNEVQFVLQMLLSEKLGAKLSFFHGATLSCLLKINDLTTEAKGKCFFFSIRNEVGAPIVAQW